MGAQNPVAGVQSLTDLDALGDRRDRTVVWAHDSTGMLVSGVVPGYGSEFSITVNSSTLQVTVGTGAAMLGGPNPATGGWPCVWLSDTITLAARDATNPRIDLLIARMADPFYYVGGDAAANVEVVTGTAGATPVAPTPAVAEGSYVVLGQLLVPSSANGGAVTLSNSTAYTQVPRAVLAGQRKQTWTCVLSQNGTACSMASPMWQPSYVMSGYLLHATGTIKTSTTHSGSGGRPTINLPVPPVGAADSYSMVGYYQLRNTGTYGPFAGPLVAYTVNGETGAVLMDNTGLAITDEGNFNIPGGAILTFELKYFVG